MKIMTYRGILPAAVVGIAGNLAQRIPDVCTPMTGLIWGLGVTHGHLCFIPERKPSIPCVGSMHVLVGEHHPLP